MTHSTYRSICVPLDGSPFAEQSLPLAAAIARASNAVLQVALVHLPVPALAPALEAPALESELDQEAREREHAYLNGVVERIRKTPGLVVSGVLLDGTVAQALEANLEQSDADLVVITTHARGPMGRFWLGSIADRLLHRLHIPVLLLRSSGSAVPPTTIRRILVTLDGSAFAEQGIGAAVSLGAPFDAEYALLMVIEPSVPIADASAMMVVPAAPDQERQALGAGTTYLEEQAERLRQDGLKVTTHAVPGDAAETIIAQAGVLHADLVTITSHGAGGLERLLVGSVADKVIRGSTHPTLVVRPPKA